MMVPWLLQDVRVSMSHCLMPARMLPAHSQAMSVTLVLPAHKLKLSSLRGRRETCLCHERVPCHEKKKSGPESLGEGDELLCLHHCKEARSPASRLMLLPAPCLFATEELFSRQPSFLLIG